MTPQEQRVAEVARRANKLAVDFAVSLSREFGEGGLDYEAAVLSAAMTLSFHSFRLALSRSKESAIESLRALLSDVAVNIHGTSGIQLEVEVRESRIGGSAND